MPKINILSCTISEKTGDIGQFLELLQQHLDSFIHHTFLIRKGELNYECKLDLQVFFQKLWVQFQKEHRIRPSKTKVHKPKITERKKVWMRNAFIVGSIISMIVVAFLLGSMWVTTVNAVEHGDSVKIDYTVWTSDESQTYDPFSPVIDTSVVLQMVPITEDGENGLILGLYNNLLGKKIGYQSEVFWVNKCIDQNRDGIDDMTGQPALSYGNSSDLYFNTCLMLQFQVLEIIKAQPSPLSSPFVITGIFMLLGLVWLGGYTAIYLFKRTPKTAFGMGISKGKEKYTYEPNQRYSMLEKNKGTRHDKEGFEPVYDWGGTSKEEIPDWAEVIIKKELAKGKKDGRLSSQELPEEFTAHRIAYCTFFFEDDKLVMRAYRARETSLKRPTRMSEILHRTRHAIASLNLKYLVVLPLVLFFSIILYYLVFIVSGFQYLDILLRDYPPVFVFYLHLIIGSSILLTLGLIFLVRKINFARLKRWREILLLLMDIGTIWATIALLNNVLNVGTVLMLYIPLIIMVWSVLWAFVYMRLRFRDKYLN